MAKKLRIGLSKLPLVHTHLPSSFLTLITFNPQKTNPSITAISDRHMECGAKKTYKNKENNIALSNFAKKFAAFFFIIIF